jgi:hypothetical protein
MLNVFRSARRFDASVRRRCHSTMLHAEHVGFVAFAATDVLNLHYAVFLIALWLLVTGLLIEFLGGVH